MCEIMNQENYSTSSTDSELIGIQQLLLGRFSLLLLSLLVLLIAASFSDGALISKIVFCLGLTSLLLVAVITICRRHKDLLSFGLALAIPTLLLSWVMPFLNHFLVGIFHNLFIMLFFLFVSYHILHAVLNDDDVSLDTIRGAVCVYLFAGIGWAYLYDTLLIIDANSIEIAALTEDSIGTHIIDTIYFSFVTLSGLGYGDQVPITRPAKLAACIEVIFGQFFVAVLVARLVGLHLRNRHENSSP
ncbi:MAG TPA: hypothetical protein DD473_11775 [Planctomycetaceae bacterium]|nr:hypothetical protein [Planctomycetaceae bacterium]